MGLEIRKVNDNFGIYNGYNDEFLRWQDLWIERDAVLNYINTNPFPQDSQYSLNDLLFDLAAEGSIIIPSKNRDTAEYICTLFQI